MTRYSSHQTILKANQKLAQIINKTLLNQKLKGKEVDPDQKLNLNNPRNQKNRKSKLIKWS